MNLISSLMVTVSPCLRQEYEGDPLIVGYHLAPLVLLLPRHLAGPRQVVGVLHPAVVLGEFRVGVREVDGCPAGDRVSDVLVQADQDGEGDQ